MAEEQNPQPVKPQGAPTGPFQIQKLYTKDVSFEIPNAPAVFQEAGQAEVKLNLSQRVNELDANNHEVVLTVTVTATVGEKTAYLAEVAQAGIFLVAGLNDQTKHAANHQETTQAGLLPYGSSLFQPAAVTFQYLQA